MKYTLQLLAFCLFTGVGAYAQSVFLEGDDDQRNRMDRFLTLYGTTGDSMHTNTNQISYKQLAQTYDYMKKDAFNARLSNVDNYEISKFLSKVTEYELLASDPLGNIQTYNQWYGGYNNTDYLLEKTGNFHFVLQPVAQSYAYFSDKKEFFYTAAAGLSTRMTIGKRIGIHARATYHRDYLPGFYENFLSQYDAVPGVGAFNRISTGGKYINGSVEYINVDAHLSYDIFKDKLTATAGYGRMFIGDGIRSLILSDQTAPMPYLSFRTNIWKLQYSNLFFKAQSQSIDYGLPGAGENKYVSMHLLSANLFPWLNVGLFETTISSRTAGPDIGYFNPVIFYRSMERAYGSPDKMALGITGKIIIKKTAQLYGQFFLNEFASKEFFAGKGFIHNKWGAQGGLKYFNMFRVANLDLQLETNWIRPFAYQHRSNANFSTSNLPMAHPLGAGFREVIGQLSYRPTTRLSVVGKLMYVEQGLDSSNAVNNGSNILKDIRTHTNKYGVDMIHGIPSKTLVGQLTGSMELGRNFYLEAGVAYRKQATNLTAYNNSGVYGFLGFRFDIARRDLFIF